MIIINNDQVLLTSWPVSEKLSLEILTGLRFALSAGVSRDAMDSLRINDRPATRSQAYKRASVVTSAALKADFILS